MSMMSRANAIQNDLPPSPVPDDVDWDAPPRDVPMTIYGQERAKPSEWWELFCSEACARTWHPDMQDVERFTRLEFFGDHIGWDAEEMAKHTLRCSECGKTLK